MKTTTLCTIGANIIWMGILCLPLLGKLFSFAPSVTVYENRTLKTKPKLRIDTIWTFPQQYEQYYNDQFSFRTPLIQAHSYLNVTVLQSSPHKDVFIGRNGWFFFIPEPTRAQHLSSSQLSQIKQKIETIHTTLANQGIRFYFIVTPNAQTIYSENLPRAINLTTPSPRDRIIDALDPAIVVVDPRQALIDAKKTHPTYRRYDTHWTDYGAFIAYQQLMNRLHTDTPSLQPRPLSDYKIVYEKSLNNDVLAMLAMKEYFSENVPVLTPRNPRRSQEKIISCMYDPNCEKIRTSVGDPSLPRLLMYRDSFSRKLIPFIGEHFSEAHYLWTYHVSQKDIDAHKPDAVILQVVERDLMLLADLKPMN